MKRTVYYAIIGLCTGEIIGVTTNFGAEHVLQEESGCKLVRINKKQFEKFGEDNTNTKVNPKNGKIEIWSNGKLVGAQG